MDYVIRRFTSRVQSKRIAVAGEFPCSHAEARSFDG